MADVTNIAQRIISNVEQVIVGKRSQLILSLVSWLCEGHILLEDVPGVANGRRISCLRMSPERPFSTQKRLSLNFAQALFLGNWSSLMK